MGFFKQWCLCVCTALIAAVILSLFTPGGSMKRFYKTLISLFVFISFLYPLRDFDIKALSLVPYSIQSEASDSTLQYEALLNEKINEELRKNGITGASVMSSVSLDYESGELRVNKVKIAVGSRYSKEEVKKTVFDSLGIDAEVTAIGE